MLQDSDSQSLLRGPLVVREISWSGPRIPIKFNALSFADHQIFLSGPKKFGNHCYRISSTLLCKMI